MTYKHKIRHWISDGIGAAVQLPPFSALAQRFFQKRSNIIFFHAIWRSDDERLRYFGGVHLDEFAKEMKRLSRMFEFVSLAEVLNGAECSTDQKPTICITFDDGFDLIDGGAAEVLEEYGAAATVFVNNDAYEYERLLWPHSFHFINADKGEQAFVNAFNEVQKLQNLGPAINSYSQYISVAKNWPQSRANEIADQVWHAAGMANMDDVLARFKPYMDAEKLKDWCARGHHVGSHCKSHFFSSGLEAANLDEQFYRPADALNSLLGLSDLPLAYPFGDRLSPALENLVIDSNAFSCLLGTDRLSGRNEDPTKMDRIEVDLGLNRYFFGEPIIRALQGR